MVGSGRNLDLESWLHLLAGMDRWNMHSLKIAGMEPTLHPDLTELISETRSFNISDLSMTTNGTRLASVLPDLIEAGLNRLTVSLHTLDPVIFKQITRGSILPVLESLDLCADFGIPTKLNVVLLRGVNDNIQDLLNYAAIKNFELKLYPLLWQPHFKSEYERYFVSWNEVIQPYAINWRGLEITEFVDPQRYRYTLETENGVRVTTSWFHHKRGSKYQLCRNCPLNSMCEEGFMGYGFETDSDLALTPCYLRPALRIDLKPFLEQNFGRIKKRLNQMAYGGNKR